MSFLPIPRLRRALAALFALAVLAGCAAPRSTVILLPDEDGHVGAVVVSGGTGAPRRVDKAFDQVVVARGESAPAPAARGKAAVDDAYAALLKAQPSRPRSFVVNFLLDSTTLTEASRAKLPEIIETARARQPTEVIVYGHADAIGSEAHNDRLSAERARVVADLLARADPNLAPHIEIRGCGDRLPLVPSNARGPEPLNRRAEVVIL